MAKVRMTYELTKKAAKSVINRLGGDIVAQEEIIPGLFWSYDNYDGVLSLNLVTADDEIVPKDESVSFYRKLIERNATMTPCIIKELEDTYDANIDDVTITLNHIKLLLFDDGRAFCALAYNPQNK